MEVYNSGASPSQFTEFHKFLSSKNTENKMSFSGILTESTFKVLEFNLLLPEIYVKIKEMYAIFSKVSYPIN